MDYNEKKPLKVQLEDLSPQEQFNLLENPTFCIYPWTHIHAYPDSSVHLCCMSDMNMPVGDLKDNTLEEIWHSEKMQNIRDRMFKGLHLKECSKCYEQDKNGFMSGRVSANKHFGHHINKTKSHNVDPNFEIVYWDVRFSNMCNFRCRTCGPLFSSNWYSDAVKLGQTPNHPKVIRCGDDKDFYEEAKRHMPYIEQFYFAGGEPLTMVEHWKILEELIRQERFDVKLIYNTNMSEMKFKGKSIFEMWKQFDSVSVGASLDGMGKRAEYIRKGTIWEETEQNRFEMLEICPNVDFYISCTLSIMNSFHMPDFHRDWMDRGLIQAQDFNINILMNPPHYRIDNLPNNLKEKLVAKYKEHIEYIRPLDGLQRATNGYESAINFINQPANEQLLQDFLKLTNQVDDVRNENFKETFPELSEL